MNSIQPADFSGAVMTAYLPGEYRESQHACGLAEDCGANVQAINCLPLDIELHLKGSLLGLKLLMDCRA